MSVSFWDGIFILERDWPELGEQWGGGTVIFLSSAKTLTLMRQNLDTTRLSLDHVNHDFVVTYGRSTRVARPVHIPSQISPEMPIRNTRRGAIS